MSQDLKGAYGLFRWKEEAARGRSLWPEATLPAQRTEETQIVGEMLQRIVRDEVRPGAKYGPAPCRV